MQTIAKAIKGDIISGRNITLTIVKKRSIAYGGMSENWTAPGDRRRFAGFALRNDLGLVNITEEVSRVDAAVLTLGSDISCWREIKMKNGILILDIVDSYLDESKLSLKRNLRGAYKSATRQIAHPTANYQRLIEEVVQNADAVVCASKEQQKKLLLLNPNVHAVVDCFEELINRQQISDLADKGHQIMWEGFPENLKHLKLLSSKNHDVWNNYVLNVVTLEKMQSRILRRHSLSTSARLQQMGIAHNLRPWTIENLVKTASECDLAIVPLDFRDKLAWNKSENKLLGLWILGIPVLASPTPSYSRVALEAGVKNCIVNDGDWALTLSRVMNNPALRLDNINNGRAYAEQIGSAQATDYGWGKVLESVGLL